MAIWQHDKRVFGIFSLRMHGKGYLGASGQKSDPTIRSSNLDHNFHYRWRVRHIFDVVHNFIWPCDLDLRPFDLGGAWWIKSLTHPTHIPIFTPYGYPFLSYVWLNLITLPSPGTVTGCACTVSRDLSAGGGGKNYPHFWNPWPFVTFKELRRRLSHVICQK